MLQRKYHPDSKIEKLCTSLRELAYELGPQSKLPSTRDLCTRFGTNQVTVNHALNALEAQNVVYRKRRSGIFVSPKLYRKSICILLSSDYFVEPDTSPFWGRLLGLLAQLSQQRAHEQNEYYTIQLLPSVNNQQAIPEEVLAAAAAGQIHAFMTVGISEPIYKWLQEQSIPSISFAGPGTWMVALDHEEMMRMAMAYLIQMGCHNIGVWKSGVFCDSYKQQRNDDTVQHCMQETLASYNHAYDPALLREGPCLLKGTDRPLNLQEQGLLLAQEVFASGQMLKPDGLFIMDDMLTNGVLIGLTRLGIRVGTDLQIVTHANVGSTVLFGYKDQLALLEVDPAQIAQAMFSLLHAFFSEQLPAHRIVTIKPVLRQPEGFYLTL